MTYFWEQYELVSGGVSSNNRISGISRRKRGDDRIRTVFKGLSSHL